MQEKKTPGRKILSTGPSSDLAKLTGMSLHAIARELGVSYSTVRTWNDRGAIPAGRTRTVNRLIKKAAEGG